MLSGVCVCDSVLFKTTQGRGGDLCACVCVLAGQVLAGLFLSPSLLLQIPSLREGPQIPQGPATNAPTHSHKPGRVLVDLAVWKSPRLSRWVVSLLAARSAGAAVDELEACWDVWGSFYWGRRAAAAVNFGLKVFFSAPQPIVSQRAECDSRINEA